MLTKRADSVTSSKWLHQAVRLARQLRLRYQVKRQILDGCIVEGRRAGGVRVATVVDPPTAIMAIGFGMVPLTEEDTEEGHPAPLVQLNPVAIPTMRDNLHWLWRPDALPIDRPIMRRTYGGLRASLAVREESQAQVTWECNAFYHGAHEYPGGVWTYGLSTTTREVVGGQETILLYRSPTHPVFYSFSFFCIRGFPNLRVGEGVLYPVYRPTTNLGLQIDSEWIEDYVGAQVVMDWPAPGTPSLVWSQDSVGQRWQAPWCYASLISLTTEVAGDQIAPVAVWRVVARISDAPQGVSDYWGSRRLVSFQVTTHPGIDPLVQPYALAQPPTQYDPSTSADVTRHPNEADPPSYYYRNTFCAPATAPRGAMVVGHVVQRLVEGTLEDFYHNVLVTTGGEFVELELESETPRSKCWFIGGDVVTVTYEEGGVEVVREEVYLLNPFMDGGMVVVNADTGDTQVVPCPAWRPPLDIDGGGRYAEDHMRNMVTSLGGSLLAFPVADSSGLTIQLATLDVATNVVQIVGTMWTAPFNAQRGGVSRIGVVQYATEDKPAILLGGYHSGVDGHGATYISYDGGVSWELFNANVGPCRGISAMGNGLYPPKEGFLWESPDGSDT